MLPLCSVIVLNIVLSNVVLHCVYSNVLHCVYSNDALLSCHMSFCECCYTECHYAKRHGTQLTASFQVLHVGGERGRDGDASEDAHDRSEDEHQTDHDAGEVDGRHAVQDDEDVVVRQSGVVDINHCFLPTLRLN